MSSEEESFSKRYSFQFAAAAAISGIVLAILGVLQYVESKQVTSKQTVVEKTYPPSADVDPEKLRLLERDQALKEQQLAAQRQQQQLQEQIQALQNKLTTLEQKSHATTATASTEASKLKSSPAVSPIESDPPEKITLGQMPGHNPPVAKLGPEMEHNPPVAKLGPEMEHNPPVAKQGPVLEHKPLIIEGTGIIVPVPNPIIEGKGRIIPVPNPIIEGEGRIIPVPNPVR